MKTKKNLLKKRIENLKRAIFRLFLNKKNLGRDIIMIVIAIGLSALFLVSNRHQLFLKQDRLVEEVVEEPVIENEAETPTVDATNWKKYQTKWYGFEIKYPESWSNPILKSATKGAKWEYRYQFRKQDTEEKGNYTGFDVVVYSVGKVKELFNTEEFPAVKNEELKKQGLCEEISGHLAENKNYSAEQIYVGANDDCYSPVYFYTLTQGNYIYNIIPILADGGSVSFQSEKEATKNLPEFISIAATFNLIDIVRPKPKPVITAQKPYVYDVDGAGRRVCNKKNDHPSKSDKGKGKHLDMECCLDPDEYPNPHCYYNPTKYGKYL